MTLQKIEFEYDIPDGYRFVRYGKSKAGERFIDSNGKIRVLGYDSLSEWVIIEEIPEQEQQTQNPKRHKHADLIHAWAEGAEIQYHDLFTGWEDIEEPGFYENDEYRIKPKTKTVRFRNYLTTNDFVSTSTIDNPDHFKKWLGDWQDVEVEE